MKTLFYTSLLLVILFSSSCDPIIEPVIVQGMSPIYGEIYSEGFIASEEPREIGELGKIVNVGDYLFINELFQGIHVVDNADPSNPIFTHFFKILGNTEFTVEGNALYADNSKDLLVIDISDFDNIVYLSHFENQYGTRLNGVFVVPPNYSGPFECVDTRKGYAKDWELITLTDPLCEAY